MAIKHVLKGHVKQASCKPRQGLQIKEGTLWSRKEPWFNNSFLLDEPYDMVRRAKLASDSWVVSVEKNQYLVAERFSSVRCYMFDFNGNR